MTGLFSQLPSSPVGFPNLAHSGDGAPGRTTYTPRMASAHPGSVPPLDADARFRALVEDAAGAVLVVDANGRIAYASPATTRILGRAPRDLIGSASIDFVHPDDRASVRATLTEIFAAHGARATREYRVRHPNGSWVWVEAFARNLLADPAVAGVVVNVRDVTDRRRAEQALRDAQAAGGVGTWEWDVRGGEVYCSDEAYRILGLDPAGDPITNDAFLALVHPADRPLLDGSRGRTWDERGSFDVSFRVRQPGGDARLVESRGRVEVGTDGDPLRLVGIIQDVTARRRLEDDLRASEARLRDAQAASGIGSWEWETTAGVLRWSDEAYRIAGLDPAGEPITFERLVELVHPDDRARVLEVVATSAVDGVFALEVRMLPPGGGERVVQIRGRAEFDAETDAPDHVRDVVHDVTGRPLSALLGGDLARRIVGTFQDVTDQRRLEDDLRAAKEEAEEASRLKSAFLSTMSHELRTPLNAITGYANLLLDGMAGELTPRQCQDIEQIAAGADRLLALINDVLDVSRMDAGMLTLEPEMVDLEAAANAVGSELVPQAAAKGVDLDIDIPAGLTVRADPLRLHQALLNLAGNAVKFTERGTVRIAARSADDAVEIDIADTGIGIAPDALPYVFDEFRQADSSTTRRYGGSGLGLAIARKIVELHGGSIRVESAPGLGSTFTVALPTS